MDPCTYYRDEAFRFPFTEVWRNVDLPETGYVLVCGKRPIRLYFGPLETYHTPQEVYKDILSKVNSALPNVK